MFFCNISPIFFLLRLYPLTLLSFTLCLPLCIYYWRACELATVPPNLLSALTPPIDEIPRKYSFHIHQLVDYYSFIVSHHFSIAYKQFLAALHFHTEPWSYKEASSFSQQQTTMDEELVVLRKTHIWDLVRLRAGKHVIICFIGLRFNLTEVLNGVFLVANAINKNMILTMKKPLLP